MILTTIFYIFEILKGNSASSIDEKKYVNMERFKNCLHSVIAHVIKFINLENDRHFTSNSWHICKYMHAEDGSSCGVTICRTFFVSQLSEITAVP